MRRLQVYTLSKGFIVVIFSSTPKRARFIYIYHGSQPRNIRGLEDHLEKDKEGNIVSRRKRDDTSSNAKNYAWEIYWSVRSLGKRGSEIIAG
jgi:hypothetical protein